MAALAVPRRLHRATAACAAFFASVDLFLLTHVNYFVDATGAFFGRLGQRFVLAPALVFSRISHFGTSKRAKFSGLAGRTVTGPSAS